LWVAKTVGGHSYKGFFWEKRRPQVAIFRGEKVWIHQI
jgi:hypothetical protein